MHFQSLLCLLRSACSSKNVKVNFEPIIDIFVKHKIFGADLLWSEALLQSLGLSSSTILISTTYIQGIVTLQAAIPISQ